MPELQECTIYEKGFSPEAYMQNVMLMMVKN